MKNLFVVLFSCGLFFVGAAKFSAQTPAPTPAPPPPQQTTPPPTVMSRQNEQRRQIDQEFERMQVLNDEGRSNRSVFSPSAISNISALYRKTTKSERLTLAPATVDSARFAEFLQQPETGLIKLAADKGCAENPNVLVATADCLAHTMPGAGGSYSFRVKDYRLPRLADITLTNDGFQATGVRLHGIFAAVGDVPLEQIDLTTKALKYLVNFTPEADFQKAKELDAKLIAGVESDGFKYFRAVKVKENMTYVLRSVAYRGAFYRSSGGIVYNELAFDKRRDVIVAFRVVRRGQDGSVTILWKLLSKQESPKTTWRKDDKENKNKTTDFTTNKGK